MRRRSKVPAVCATCGLPLSEHERDVRFLLPDPVLDLPEREHTAGTWMSHDDANSSVMMQVPGVGPFCRALIPVDLDGGYTLRFGVWIGIHPDELQRAFKIWETPYYPQLELDGLLANAIPMWDALGSPVHTAVLNPDHTPYVVGSPDENVAEALRRTWPHEQVLAHLPR